MPVRSFEIVAVASSRLTRDTEEGRLAHTLDSEGVDVVMAPDQLFGAISPVRTPSGIIAVAQRRPALAVRHLRATGRTGIAGSRCSGPR